MTQPDALADTLAATSLLTDHSSDASAEQTAAKPVIKSALPKSFASALGSGQINAPSILRRDAPTSISSNQGSSAEATTSPDPVVPPSPVSTSLSPVEDIILQAIRKRDDRIFFSQYENQMSALVQDPLRSQLELAAMNSYQRLLIHRCADQFQLDHQLDKATQCIMLSKTATTSHPDKLLSIRAREQLVQRDGIDPINTHPALARPSSATTMSPDPVVSPPPPTAGAHPSADPGTPKGGFMIMRRDPSSSRQSRFRSGDTDSDSDKSKARKEMTLEEREASYKAARARIFGEAASSSSSSPGSSTPALELVTESDQPKASPESSAASSPVAGRTGGKKKQVPSSSSSVASQDGQSTQRKGAAGRSKEGTDDELEFCRTLPLASSAFFGQQQSSPLALPGHMAQQGYFPIQQSHSNPNLRSRAPVFHPQGSSTPNYAQGGALRYPDNQLQPQPMEPMGHDAFPALGSNPNGVNRGGQSRGGVWNRGPASMQQQDHVNGVNAWAQQTSTFVQPRHQQQHFQPYHQQQQQGQGYQLGMGMPTAPLPYNNYRSANSSRASSQRGGAAGAGRGARDDAVSVGSVASTASSRSASFTGASGGQQQQGNGSKIAPAAPLSHPSLPARPAWLAPSPPGGSVVDKS